MQAAMWWVAHVIFMSAQGPNPSFFLEDFYSTWDKGLDSDLDQGLTIPTTLYLTELDTVVL